MMDPTLGSGPFGALLVHLFVHLFGTNRYLSQSQRRCIAVECSLRFGMIMNQWGGPGTLAPQNLGPSLGFFFPALVATGFCLYSVSEMIVTVYVLSVVIVKDRSPVKDTTLDLNCVASLAPKLSPLFCIAAIPLSCKIVIQKPTGKKNKHSIIEQQKSEKPSQYSQRKLAWEPGML